MNMGNLHPAARGAFALGVAAAVTATAVLTGGRGKAPAEPSRLDPASAVRAEAPEEPAAARRRIVVSLKSRKLWLIEGRDTLIAAPVAVGKGQTFSYRGKTYHFRTPRGTRRVLAKEPDPVWTPPDWHYYEKAARNKLEPVHVEDGKEYVLRDGTVIVKRGDQVGRINRFGNFWPFTPGMEIVFDGKIFIPPIGTAQRRIPNALGPYKLDLGDGYLIHGTHDYNHDSVGRAVSHGCIRMRNEDITKLYELVEVGTPVQIT